MNYSFMVAAAALAIGALSTAEAHPGSKLLTTGGGERTAMTAGVTYTDVKGVHLFKGAPRQAGNDMATLLMGAPANKVVSVVVTHKAPWRSFRRLRTQGFYSGRGPASRAYTQGFYSGN